MLTNRSWTDGMPAIVRAPNSMLWWVMGSAVVFLGAVLNIPALCALFRFSPLHAVDLLFCSAAGLFSILWFELFKIFNRRRYI